MKPMLGLALGLAISVPWAAGTAWAQSEPLPLSDCEELVARQPEGWDVVRCFYRWGREAGLWEETERRLLAHSTENPENPWLAYALGAVRKDQGDPSAELPLAEAARGFALLGEATGEVYARINRFQLLHQLGRQEEAEDEFELALKSAEGADDQDLRNLVTLRRVSQLVMGREDLDQAYRLLRRLEAEVFPDGPTKARIDCLLELGNVTYHLGRYAEARLYYERLARLAGDQGNLYDEAVARFQIALTHNVQHAGRNAWQEARRLASQALAAAQAAGHPTGQAGAHLILGKLLPGEEGRRHLEACLEVARQLPTAQERGECLWALARNRVAHDPDEARRLVAEAVPLATDQPWLGHSWTDRMQVQWALKPRQEAIADSLAVIETIESIRQLQETQSGRTQLFSGWAEVYAGLSGRLLDTESGTSTREDLEQAFAVAERMRARVLLDALDSAAVVADLPADERLMALMPLMDELREILDRKVQVNRRLLDAGLGRLDRAAVLVELEALEDEEAEQRRRIALAFPALEGVSRARASFATLDQVEANLEDDEALLSFQVAQWEDIYGDFAGGAWLLVSTRQGTRVERLPDRLKLEPAVRMLLGLCERRGSLEAAPGATAPLYEDLLASALELLPAGVERLILVPDGMLHLLPFAALKGEGDPQTLAGRYQISMVSSASLWLRWRQAEPPTQATEALVLADPALGSTVEGQGGSGTRAWSPAGGAALPALPYARREGRALRRYLGSSSRVLAGDQASERLVKEADLSRFGVLHFAAHAVIDDRHPQRSAVVLAPGAEDEDGLLQPREIAELDLDAPLVVLSACQSASGAVLGGEGVMSLARAFFQGGARTVVGSLWRLRDDDAASLFGDFYRHLGAGLSVDEALRAAQRNRREDGAPAAAWAGLVVLGDGSFVPLPGGRPPTHSWGSWWAFPLAVIGLAATVGWWRHRRSRHGVSQAGA